MSRGFQQNEAGEWEPFDDDFVPPPTCRNCKDPIDDGHKEFCGMCREMGCT